MTLCPSRAVSAMVICLTVLVAPAMLVAATELERNSLKGLPGVVVVVEDLRAGVDLHGLTVDIIKTDVELRLRRSGIRVFSSPLEDPSPAMASVYVNLNIITYEGLYAASIFVELQQVLRSSLSGLLINGTTWQRTSVAIVGGDRLRQSLRDAVNDEVDTFINDYLAANPKRQ